MLCLIKKVNIRVMFRLFSFSLIGFCCWSFPLEYCLLVSRFLHPPQITQKLWKSPVSLGCPWIPKFTMELRVVPKTKMKVLRIWDYLGTDTWLQILVLPNRRVESIGTPYGFQTQRYHASLEFNGRLLQWIHSHEYFKIRAWHSYEDTTACKAVCAGRASS